MRVFAERQVIPTIYAVGMALERNPQAAETMARQGCDLSGLHVSLRVSGIWVFLQLRPELWLGLAVPGSDLPNGAGLF